MKDAPEVPDGLLDLYRQLLLIRRFEEKAGQLYGMGLIGGFCHLYIGQEAVVVGVEAVAKPGDKRITAYRNHGHMLACGMDPNRIMAELTGRADGYSGGKGGSMHMASPEHGYYGGSGIVGASAPVGVGLAFADAYRKNSAVTFVYVGDAAADQGQVFEAFNLAARLTLPVVFVIENNAETPDTPSTRMKPTPALHTRGAAFGIPSAEVDGMDVLTVKAAAEKAARHARSGKGPYVLEAKTYRYRGHSMSDPAKYRTREEMHRVRDKKDALEHARTLLVEGGVATAEDLKAMDKEIKAVVSAAAAHARETPAPALDSLHADVVAS